MFLVLEGRMRIEMEDGAVELGEGELFVVPKGVRHNPVAEEECLLLLVERKSTLHTGDACRRQGAKGVNGTTVPQGVYPTKGGGPNDYIILYCHPSVPEQFQRLLDIIGRPDLKGHPDFISQAARAGREEEVNAMIAAWTVTRSKDEAMRIIGEARIPVGAVRDTRDLYDDASFEERGAMLWEQMDGRRPVHELVRAFEEAFPDDRENAVDRVCRWVGGVYRHGFVRFRGIEP